MFRVRTKIFVLMLLHLFQLAENGNERLPRGGE